MSLKLSSTGTSVTVKPQQAVKKIEPKLTYVQKVIGGETYLVMAQSSIELEDEFSNLYFTTEDSTKLFLQPPFDPQVMLTLVQTNNTLNQCVEVMEVNVDGTGHDFVKADDDKEIDKTELAAATALFNEPYPCQSMIKIRRKLRREIESVGYGYLEILRNAKREIVGWRNVPTHNVRMVKLDKPVLVTRKIMRGGEEVEFKLWERERRFAQRVAMPTLVYYKEFGVERDLHRETGEWVVNGKLEKDPNKPVTVEQLATELLMVGLHPDIKSPYFVPRWVNQMPSVVGSRKAEEQNLEYFDSGGMPPAIIFIQGGTLATDAADQLRNYLTGKNKNKYRAVVVEAQSSSGSLESAGSVQVKVERFGGEKANDALYANYDKTAGEHVRVGFRIPPLFLGVPADYNFATAVTAYMVAEEQVFAPERKSFDDLINSTLVRAIGWKTLKLKSKPITLKDAANQLTAITLVKDLVEPKSVVDAVNGMTGLDLEIKPPPPEGTPMGPGQVMGPDGHPVNVPKDGPGPLDAAQVALTHSQAAANDAKAGLKPGTSAAEAAKAMSSAQPKTPGTPPQSPKAKKTALELIDLAQDYAAMKGLVHKHSLSEERALVVKAEVAGLDKDDLQAMNDLLASYTFGSNSHDLVTLAAECAHTH